LQEVFSHPRVGTAVLRGNPETILTFPAKFQPLNLLDAVG
jgi:hypothetical protein